MTTASRPYAVIDAWAAYTALGQEVDTLLDDLLAGRHGLSPLPYDTHAYTTTLCAPITQSPRRSRDARFARRMDLLGLEVALDLANSAQLEGGDRLGVFVGYGGLRAHWDEMMPSLMHQHPDQKALWARGFRDFHPFWMLRHLSNNAHALCATALDARGEGLTLAGANAGAQALESAILALNQGVIDCALVFAYDSLIQPDVLVELAAQRVTHQGPLDAYRAAYDQDPTGLIPGEAVAAMILRREEDALSPRAKISACTGADGEDKQPQTQTLIRTALPLLTSTHDLIISGAAPAQAEWDAQERALLAQHVPQHTPLLWLPGALGYTGAAHALLQAIALTQALDRGLLPPIHGLQDVASGPLIPITTATPTMATVGLGLSMFAPGLTGAILVEKP